MTLKKLPCTTRAVKTSETLKKATSRMNRIEQMQCDLRGALKHIGLAVSTCNKTLNLTYETDVHYGES